MNSLYSVHMLARATTASTYIGSYKPLSVEEGEEGGENIIDKRVNYVVHKGREGGTKEERVEGMRLRGRKV